MPKELNDVKIAILTCPFEPPKPKTKHKVRHHHLPLSRRCQPRVALALLASHLGSQQRQLRRAQGLSGCLAASAIQGLGAGR